MRFGIPPSSTPSPYLLAGPGATVPGTVVAASGAVPPAAAAPAGKGAGSFDNVRRYAIKSARCAGFDTPANAIFVPGA